MTFVCAQDKRKEKLLKEGYVETEKAVFHIGRSLFLVQKFIKKVDFRTHELDAGESQYEMLKIDILGDPDSGLTLGDQILLGGGRFGLYDLYHGSRLLKTVHGDQFEIIRNLADDIYWFARKNSNLEPLIVQKAEKIKEEIFELLNYIEKVNKEG